MSWSHISSSSHNEEYNQIYMERHICRYGVPSKIITDNATNFLGKDLELLCKKFKIHHHWSSPYRPQMNGVVEAANKNLKKIL